MSDVRERSCGCRWECGDSVLVQCEFHEVAERVVRIEAALHRIGIMHPRVGAEACADCVLVSALPGARDDEVAT